MKSYQNSEDTHFNIFYIKMGGGGVKQLGLNIQSIIQPKFGSYKYNQKI